jgi:hypothetical protein
MLYIFDLDTTRVLLILPLQYHTNNQRERSPISLYSVIQVSAVDRWIFRICSPVKSIQVAQDVRLTLNAVRLPHERFCFHNKDTNLASTDRSGLHGTVGSRRGFPKDREGAGVPELRLTRVSDQGDDEEHAKE